MDKTNHHKGSPTINGKNDHNQPDTINKRKTNSPHHNKIIKQLTHPTTKKEDI